MNHPTLSQGDGTTAELSGDSAPVGPLGFELLDEVGRCGMGVVYRARDIALARDVAVKVIADRYAPDSLAAQRVLTEPRVTSQLQHPGIPAVHQVGTRPAIPGLEAHQGRHAGSAAEGPLRPVGGARCLRLTNAELRKGGRVIERVEK